MGHGVDKRALFVEDIGDEWNDAVDLLPAVGKAFQKHRHVVVGLVPRVAACREPNSTTRSMRSPYSASSAARKRFRTGSAAGQAGIGYGCVFGRIHRPRVGPWFAEVTGRACQPGESARCGRHKPPRAPVTAPARRSPG